MHYSFEIPVTPVAKGRPRFSRKNGIAFTPSKTRKAEQDIRYFLSQVYKSPPLSGPLAVALYFSFLRPKSVSAKKRPFMTAPPDGNNLFKLVEDACNGLLWVDDKQIVTSHCMKAYGDREYILIDVFEYPHEPEAPKKRRKPHVDTKA